jgi:hypothetical protein
VLNFLLLIVEESSQLRNAVPSTPKPELVAEAPFSEGRADFFWDLS